MCEYVAIVLMQWLQSGYFICIIEISLQHAREVVHRPTV